MRQGRSVWPEADVFESRPRRALAALALVLALGLGAAPREAFADQIGPTDLLDQTSLVYSTQSSLYSFTAPSSGSLAIHLYDLAWPSAMTELTLSVLSPDAVLGSLSQPGELDLQLTQGATLYAYVVGQADALSGLGMGMYSLHVDFTPLASPVPLPKPIWLVLTGLALMALQPLLAYTRRFVAPRNESVMCLA
jgi:hypothetical protein